MVSVGKSTIFKEKFKIFQFCEREISKTTLPNPPKFYELVRHVPKYVQSFFLTKYISPVCISNLKKYDRKMKQNLTDLAKS